MPKMSELRNARQVHAEDLRDPEIRAEYDRTALAHWCTIRVSVIPDGLLMRPRCRQFIALLA